MSVDSNGGMIVVGSFLYALNVGGADLGLANVLTSDAFVARFDKNDGAHKFSVTSATDSDVATASPSTRAVTCGSPACSGYGLVRRDSLTSAGNTDIFVARLDLDGNVVSAFKRGDAGNVVNSIAIDSTSGVSCSAASRRRRTSTPSRRSRPPVSAGEVGGTTDGRIMALARRRGRRLRGSGITTRTPSTTRSSDVSTRTARKWTKRWGADGNDIATAIAIGPDGAVLVGGSTKSISYVDYGGSPIGASQRMFLAELADDGTHRCSRVFATINNLPPPDGTSNVGARPGRRRVRRQRPSSPPAASGHARHRQGTHVVRRRSGRLGRRLQPMTLNPDSEIIASFFSPLPTKS
jgi:hypothetical protein